MPNYYGFNTDGGNTNDLPGFELSGPVAVLGVALVIVSFILSASNLVQVATPPVPSLVALGLAVLVYFLTHIADELGRKGLWLILAFCMMASVAVVPFVLALISGEGLPLLGRSYDEAEAYRIGAAYWIYLGVVEWLVVSRLWRGN